MEIIRVTFQKKDGQGRMALVLDLEEEAGLTTADIPHLADKMQIALPGIFPDESSQTIHSCGGGLTGIPKHSLREEIAGQTSIPHLLEHILLHLLSRGSCSCGGLCGQRSVDIEQGIATRWHIIVDCPSELEGVIAVGIGFELIYAWLQGKTVIHDPAAIFANIQDRIEQMLCPTVVTSADGLRL